VTTDDGTIFDNNNIKKNHKINTSKTKAAQTKCILLPILLLLCVLQIIVQTGSYLLFRLPPVVCFKNIKHI